MAVSVQQTMQSINAACRQRGGKYAQYSCQVVSWDDVSRGKDCGALSCWGANITDTYLKSKDGTQLFTVRSDNWNEKLGRITSDELAVVAGNHVPGGNLAPTTLRNFLTQLHSFGAYAGIGATGDLSNEDLDQKCSIRFQTTFLPVSGNRGTLEFATEAYNYNTMSDDDPRNLVLLCTSQGVAVQQDGAGAKRLFHHGIDEDGVIHRYWLEAERSDHKVGGPQRENAEERADALKRGKATANVIGTRAMGTRFNVLMTIQVPLKQKKPIETDMDCESLCCDMLGSMEDEECHSMCYAMSGSMLDEECCSNGSFAHECNSTVSLAAAAPARRSMAASKPPLKMGTANAARVSCGSEFDTWPGLSVVEPERHTGEHVTITVVVYNTVADGVPSEADVVAAIDDLEALYLACGVTGQLADSPFDFMKKDLTAQDVQGIQAKIAKQPLQQPSQEDPGRTERCSIKKTCVKSCVVS